MQSKQIGVVVRSPRTADAIGALWFSHPLWLASISNFLEKSGDSLLQDFRGNLKAFKLLTKYLYPPKTYFVNMFLHTPPKLPITILLSIVYLILPKQLSPSGSSPLRYS